MWKRRKYSVFRNRNVLWVDPCQRIRYRLSCTCSIEKRKGDGGGPNKTTAKEKLVSSHRLLLYSLHGFFLQEPKNDRYTDLSASSITSCRLVPRGSATPPAALAFFSRRLRTPSASRRSSSASSSSSLTQGWKKPGILKKKPAQWVFFVFFCFFLFFLFFFVFFCFFFIYLPRRESF